MTESRLDDLFDELVPPFAPGGDGWDDVLARSRATRSRYVVLAVAALALLLVPTAVALRGQIADLFQGTPAPPAVTTSFERLNRIPGVALQRRFGDKFPHADVSRAHGVLEIQTSDGPEDLWAAPDDQGGRCWWVSWANDPPGADGSQYGFGGCDRPDTGTIDPALIWVEPHPRLQTLWGRVYVHADHVVVDLQDGAASTLPVIEGGFLASFGPDAKLARVRAYEGDTEVATWEARVG